ncbi:DUF5107 domain-containing protein [Demequina sp. NBRC 110056]|uniref:DUF5107 domain-containing protein n=1 Tax=Demequina sp. NBRC 110056 TaxID=1570345 RepID=UPI0009FF82C3|nr:DUF5107 domain-containing protein [Demequina sp. NBRC 110056]
MVIDDDHVSEVLLPPAPAAVAGDALKVWREPIDIDTYEPEEPDGYPTFFDKRVYQGSSGAVFPLPFHERISQTKSPRAWDAVHLENRWIRLVLLPELGGRIYVGYDKAAEYDFFYRNNVIKPALVGLAGPWVSGGVEFNWPQHHRPATFLPTEVDIEREVDGAVTVWMSDHDPMRRMRGTHGIRLRPDSSLIELRVRLYNRTTTTQTFLWWANVAAAVNDDYQSFFPTDVAYVADHARRALTEFPAARTPYYGIDYAARAAEAEGADRIDWYKNILVPTSYMVTDTADDFFGGYDHGRRAGFVHVADRRIAPGKKQWTWGNAPFGWAWDANLTDTDGPYVELMAGVFTDNQPDFSFLAPGETRAFSQFWYPIQGIGPAHQASTEAAVSLDVTPDGARTAVRVGVCVTRERTGGVVELSVDGAVVERWPGALRPGEPLLREVSLEGEVEPTTVELVVRDGSSVLLRWRPRDGGQPQPALAHVPPAPADVQSADELTVIASYLDQYRHAARSPEDYWAEALSRDAGDARSHVALARRELARGRWAEAAAHAREAVARVTQYVPNPSDGEAHYLLGLALERTGDLGGARDAWGKAMWSAAWRAPAGYELACAALREGDPRRAADLLTEVLAANASHAQARCALAVALWRLGDDDAAQDVLDDLFAEDPMDAWGRVLRGEDGPADATMVLDIALEFRRVGEEDDAVAWLERAVALDPEAPLGQVRVAPVALAHLAAAHRALGDEPAARKAWARLEASDARWCLPARAEDADALALAAAQPGGAVASLLLGHWWYHHRCHGAAESWWRAALAKGLDSTDRAVVLRNLAIAAYNVHREPELADDLYEQALAAAPADPRLLHERDQLRARRGVPATVRLGELEAHLDAVSERDDLVTSWIGLLVDAGRLDEAQAALSARRFQPWEGGEGLVLAQWDRCHLALARRSADAGRWRDAVQHLRAALEPPASLGEARHPLANTAELHWELGRAMVAVGDHDGARQAWDVAAQTTRDFAGMSERSFGSQVASTVRALRDLGREDEAREVLARTRSAVAEHARVPAEIDYFATSLPTMLLFDDDPSDARDRLVATILADLEAADLRALEATDATDTSGW